MNILRKTWNGIEYYLIDKYEIEFYFGIVYHFISDNDEKFCFYKNSDYIPIKNKNYLRKIANELKVNCNILSRNSPLNNIDSIKKKNSSSDKERWDSEKEFQTYDEVSNIIHELFPDISHKDTMEILNDDSGIYSVLFLDNDGTYYHKTKEIHLNKFIKKLEIKKRAILHEMIHKLTDRNDFLSDNNKYFVGLIEGATEKICEDKYGDKTSHTIYLDNIDIHINFSLESSYKLPQILYRQMSKLVEPKMADKSIVNGDKSFFDSFSDLYGKDLFLYLNHRANRLLKESLPEKRKLKYLKESQYMILTKAFDRKFLYLQTKEDIINYMSELRNFEHVTAKIEGDTSFQDYYNSKYNAILQLAQQKALNLSNFEQYKYSEVDFYPERNQEKARPFEIKNTHISNLLETEDFDLSRCKRIQIDSSPNFFNLDMILANGIPISVVYNGYSYYISHITCNDLEFYDIKRDFDIKDSIFDAYDIAPDTYIIIKPDGSSVICSKSSKTGKIYYHLQNEVALDITPNDIKEGYNQMKREFEAGSDNTHAYVQIPLNLVSVENKKGTSSLFDNFKKFFRNIFAKKNLKLPPPITNLLNDSSKNKHLIFANQLDPNNENYSHNSIVPLKNSEHSTEKPIDIEQEIDN